MAKNHSLDTQCQYVGILLVNGGNPHMPLQDVGVLVLDGDDPHMPLKYLRMLVVASGDPNMPWDVVVLLIVDDDSHIPWKDVRIRLADCGDPHMLRHDDVATGSYYRLYWWRGATLWWTKCKWRKEHDNGHRIGCGLCSNYQKWIKKYPMQIIWKILQGWQKNKTGLNYSTVFYRPAHRQMWLQVFHGLHFCHFSI